jgi:hypothetical protein
MGNSYIEELIQIVMQSKLFVLASQATHSTLLRLLGGGSATQREPLMQGKGAPQAFE